MSDPESNTSVTSLEKPVAASFDPRREVSEDAKYIARHISSTLWTIFVLLPICLGLLLVIGSMAGCPVRIL